MSPYIRDYILLALVSFGISVILTPIIRRKSQESGQALDFPVSPRKIHGTPIPRLGGIAIYGGFFLSLLLILFTDGETHALFNNNLDVLFCLWGTSTLVFLIGLYDDFRGATVSQKFFVQILAAVLAYWGNFTINTISIPFVGSMPLGILGLPVTLLWFVGVTNALNFIDGVDGLACGVGFFSISTMFGISLFLHHPLTAFFAAALAGSLFGFAMYNFNPASIFMGDSGSLFVGFIIAAIALQGSQKSSTTVVLLLPIIVLGVPIADTLLAIIRRIGNGLSPFSADKDHIHHRLLNMGLSSRQVVLVLYIVCSLLGTVALLMTAVKNQMLTLILLVLSVMTIGGMKMLGYTADMIALNTTVRERIQQKKRVLRRQRFAEEILIELENAPDYETLLKILYRYFEQMDFDVVRCCCDDARMKFGWKSPRYASQSLTPELTVSITLPLIVREDAYGNFTVEKFLPKDSSVFEYIMDVENVQQALEHKLSRMTGSPIMTH